MLPVTLGRVAVLLCMGGPAIDCLEVFCCIACLPGWTHLAGRLVRSPHAPTSQPALMTTRTSMALLFLGAVIIPVCLWLFFQERQTSLPSLDPAPRVSAASQEAPDLQPEVSQVPSREAESIEELDIEEMRALYEKQKAEEEAQRGIIFGNIVDSDGTRINHGRVFLFTSPTQVEPVKVLELEGPDMEYRCELQAGKYYYLHVDPTSLGAGYVPALVESRQKINRRSGKKAEPNDPKNFTRYFVALKDGEEVRQDLRVGALAQVTGRLVAWDGKPMPGVHARITGLDSDIIGLSEDSITDQDGVFSFFDVYPSHYRLRFSQAAAWNPPVPIDFTIKDREAKDLGDIQVGGGQKSIRGFVVNQDGEPFAGLKIVCFSNQPVKKGVRRHSFASALSSTRTAEDGFFELSELPSIPVKVTFTSSYEPNRVSGAGYPAVWELAPEVDLETGNITVDIGTHTVQESRPFEIKGQVVFDGGWLASSSNHKRNLRTEVSQVKGQSLPEGIRRFAPKRKAVKFDLDDDNGQDTYLCLVETPMTEVEVRFQLKGFDDLVFIVQPEALESWAKDIRVPLDFSK